jgi:hypothetical protein
MWIGTALEPPRLDGGLGRPQRMGSLGRPGAVSPAEVAQGKSLRAVAAPFLATAQASLCGRLLGSRRGLP